MASRIRLDAMKKGVHIMERQLRTVHGDVTKSPLFNKYVAQYVKYLRLKWTTRN
jgi:hypothetical protein